MSKKKKIRKKKEKKKENKGKNASVFGCVQILSIGVTRQTCVTLGALLWMEGHGDLLDIHTYQCVYTCDHVL